jgi:nitroreductase
MPESGNGDATPRLVQAALRVGPNFTRFAPRELPDATLEHVIELARLAPSEWNLQPWRWIVVRSQSGKKLLEASAQIRVPLSSAPAVLICLADTLAWKSAPQHLQEMVANKKITEEESREVLRKFREFYGASPETARRTALANAFVALHQMVLAAAGCDLSAFWVSEFDELKLKTDFHIPDNFLVAALLAIGYREAIVAPPTPKLPLRALVYNEKFGHTWDHQS